MPFTPAPPLRGFRRTAEAELKGMASAAEVQRLYGEPLLWMKALSSIMSEVNRHIARARADLRAAAAGIPRDDPRHVELVKTYERQAVGRMHFRAMVETRLEEVTSLLGTKPVVGWQTTGDIARTFTTIAQLIEEDDVTAAQDCAWYWAKKWSRQADADAAREA